MAPAEAATPPDDRSAGSAGLNVQVALSPGPREVRLVALSLPVGATVQVALLASGLLTLPAEPAPKEEAGQLHVGIWGRKASLDTVLREGDRVECYRGLQVDPKEARRVRYRAHGEKLPKGIHRPRGRVADMTQAPGKPLDEPAD